MAKTEYKVMNILKSTAVDFIQKFHYSPVMPSITKHYLGFYLDTELKGVLTLGWGTQPRQTINKMFPGLGTPDYYEIGKMCMDDDQPKNSESQMMAATIRWLKQNKPDVKFLYTMADGIMGKCGYVYQASNFLFGEKYWTNVYMMENGEKLHPRSSKSLLIDNAKFSGKEKLFWLTADFMRSRGIKKIDGYMFRYIYPLNKAALKLIKTGSTLDWSRNYPKDVDLQWRDSTDAKNKTFITQPPFTFEDAKYNLKNINSHRVVVDNTTFSELFQIEE